MDSLVSYEEQYATPLQALDARVRVVRAGPLGGWLVYRRVLAGEPHIARCRLTGSWVLDLEDLAEAVFRPECVIVHGKIRRCERLHDYLAPVRRQIVRKLNPFQAVTDVAVDGWIVDVGP